MKGHGPSYVDVRGCPNAIDLLGVRVVPMTISELHDTIGRAVEGSGKIVITSQNLHGVYMYHRTEKLRALHARSVPRIDGMPLVWIGSLLGYPVRREHRVTWVDWMDPLMAHAAARGWRVYYLGGRPGVADRAAQVLRQRHPGLDLVTRHGHFDAEKSGEENREVLESIMRARPQVLMVGMGMPRQEVWVEENLHSIHANAVLTCGAAFDYVAGEIPTPPRWMGRVGLEWLYRLLSEPRRLASRYLIEPWFLSGLLARDLWNHWLRRR